MEQFDIDALKLAWVDFPAMQKIFNPDLGCELSLSFGHINDIEMTIYKANNNWVNVYEFLCLVGQKDEWLPGDLYPDEEPGQGPEGLEDNSYRNITAAELREKLTDETLSMYGLDTLACKLLQPETATAIWVKHYWWDYKEFVLQYPDHYRYICVRYVY